MTWGVVVVDDHDSVRALVRAAIEADDRFRVVGEAADGDSAVALVAALGPDAVVLDLSMPGTDGLAAITAIAAAHPGLAIVVHSELVGERETTLTKGARAFVAKTAPTHELLDALARAIEARGEPPPRSTADEQAHRFLEALPVGVAIVEPGRMVFINRVGREILGTGDLEALEGSEIIRHFHMRRESTGEPYPFDELPIARALFKGETTRADDVVIARPDGSTPVESYAAPVTSVDGTRQYAVTAFTDVSERRAQDARLARALASLEAANESLTEFAAVAAHDLAAPLRTVSGFAELLRERYGEQLPDEAREWIGHVLDEADRMRSFIEELLTYASAGAPSSPAAEVDLGAVARRARAALAPQIEDVGATVEIDELPPVIGDETRLAQVLQNLLANALVYRRPDRSPVVRVDAEAADAMWIVSVTDDGVGVPEAERSRVFAPFSRGSSGATAPGHGLGLTICRRIVERHGGRIWVEDAPGGGSRFRFTLPRAFEASSADRAARRRGERAGQSR